MHRSVPAIGRLVNAARQLCGICETKAPLNTPSESYVHGINLWRRIAIWPLSAFLRLWWRTIRVEIPAKDLETIILQGDPTIYILWHNRLFAAADVVRRFRAGHPLCCLISASEDGAWLTALFSSFGIRTVRGSSSRLGREATAELIGALANGYDVGITPDGPRGPCYKMKPGALVVARRARTRVVLVGFDYESSWRLGSWDGFHIPKPLSLIHMRFEVAGPDELEDRDEAAADLGRRLAELNPDRKPAPVRRPAKA
jgi:lysophospholipid acyltransferase (LPLAT)-like uncharacterized protein